MLFESGYIITIGDFKITKSDRYNFHVESIHVGKSGKSSWKHEGYYSDPGKALWAVFKLNMGKEPAFTAEQLAKQLDQIKNEILNAYPEPAPSNE
jgi:hypothetical protein